MKLTSVRLLRRQEGLKVLRAVTEPVTRAAVTPVIVSEEREIARLQVELDATTSELSEEIKSRVDT